MTPSRASRDLRLRQKMVFSRFLLSMWVQAHPQATLDQRIENRRVIHEGIELLGLEWVRREMTQSLHVEMAKMHIFSMTKRWDNLSMWAKYSDNHREYCLEFANAGIFGAAREVEYGDTIELDLTDPDAANAAFFFRKKSDWSNEEEVRLLLPSAFPSQISIPADCLTRIILGKDIKASDRKQIRQWAVIRVPELTVVETDYDAFEQVLKLVGIRP